MSNDATAVSFIDEQIEKLEHYKLIALDKCTFFEESEKLECQNISLTLGEIYPHLPKLRQQLIIKGFLFDEKTKDDFIYDEALKMSIQFFQKRNFLPETGIFDTKTCKALNRPLKNEIALIQKNIDRLQKLKNTIKDYKKVVVINVPQYELLCVNNGCVDIVISVIVGSPSRPTPIRTDSISAIMVNPSWTIPENILVKDKIKVFSKKPDYFENQGYMILDHEGDELEPSSIDWEDVKKYPNRYKIRQRPGKKNALGLFKFVMNNPDDIHLHGTNQPDLFNKHIRSLSSGCIRLEDPKSFAQWLLEGQASQLCKIDSTSTSKCLLNVLSDKLKKTHTQSLPLNKPVPVLFSYITMWADRNGNVYTNDPYRKDL